MCRGNIVCLLCAGCISQADRPVSAATAAFVLRSGRHCRRRAAERSQRRRRRRLDRERTARRRGQVPATRTTPFTRVPSSYGTSFRDRSNTAGSYWPRASSRVWPSSSSSALSTATSEALFLPRPDICFSLTIKYCISLKRLCRYFCTWSFLIGHSSANIYFVTFFCLLGCRDIFFKTAPSQMRKFYLRLHRKAENSISSLV